LKKNWILFSALAIFAMAFLGCDSQVKQQKRLSIVATTFPEYDWVKNIVGNDSLFEITLLEKGVDLHSFEPTPENILQISKADLFIYVGGESDEWVEKALENPQNPNRKVVNMMQVLGEKVKAEQIVEGMEEEHHHEEDEEMDEHVWLSLQNASILVRHIADSLVALSPEKKEMIVANANAYREKLEALDAEFAKVIVPGKTILFGDRFPFRYLVDDYKISYYAAFVGCSAETEASFKTIAFLAKKVDELNLKTIFVLESRTHKIAETIRDNTKSKDQQILPLHSIQSISDLDLQNGVNYYMLMQQNLEVLKRAL
jgi:zinc transport system substrate-binding protein